MDRYQNGREADGQGPCGGKDRAVTRSSEFAPNFRFPVGTQVVLRRDLEGRCGDAGVTKKSGSVGEVVEQPVTHDYAYTIVFADGTRLRARHRDLSIRRSIAPEKDVADREIEAYRSHLIVRVAMGSHAYGLATEDSDVDEKGIYLPPAAWHWSIHPLPEQIEFKRGHAGEIVLESIAIDGDDYCWWEIEKFLRLALKANPTALELLFAPDSCVRELTEVGERLFAIRDALLSNLIYQTYSGYALSQFRRMKRTIAAGKSHRPKHAMHLIRLLLSGITAVRTGEVQVDMSAHREELLAIKDPEYPFAAVFDRALELDAEFQSAMESSVLPQKPNVEAVDAFLIEARRAAV